MSFDDRFNKSRKRFKIITGIFIVMFILSISVYTFIGYTVYDEVQEAGGVKQALIKAGKEVKDIHEQIMEDDNEN
jgi:hypothetical protein